MNSHITLIVADDHPILLNGLVNQLKDYNYKILASAENGAVALDKIMDLQPDYSYFRRTNAIAHWISKSSRNVRKKAQILNL